MSADDMRKLMEAVVFEVAERHPDANKIYEAISELEDLNEQMKDAINAFDTILRQAVGYDDIIYSRFQSYPGGHIKASLGTGGYGDRDTTLDEIIGDLYERVQPTDDEMDESVTAGSNIIALKTLASAIRRVWDQIAYDIPADSVSSIDMIELATDAGRLEMNGYDEEQEIFRNLVNELGVLGAYKKIASVLPYDSWEAGGGEDSSWH
jgi:hypothetical protein